ncbi:MAG: PLDc N-terminal domain-containing protein [Cyclobacteriaceae bacterium]
MNSLFLLAIPSFWAYLIIIPLFVFPILFWVWAIVDVIRRDFTEHEQKLSWLMLVILIPVIGAVIYHQRGKTQGVLR